MSALHVRLTLAFAALLAVVGFALVALLSRTSDRYSDEVRQRLDAGISMYVVRELALIEKGTVNPVALRELADRAMTVNPAVEVYLLDRGGRVLSTVVQHGRVVRSRVSLGPIEDFLRAPERRPIYGDDPSTLEGKRVFSVAAIQDHGRLDGYLYVVLGGRPERSIAQHVWGSYALRVATVALGLVILATLLVAGGLFAVLTRRLRRLDRSMESWSRTLPAGAFPARSVAGGDEISALSAHFTDMSQAIERQMLELKGTDELRRELVSNVSHDLRTPLASLRGYIETLLIKHGSMSPQELQSHLRIALRQSDQLGRLIDALFELARLESGVVVPAIEAVSIAELLQDVALRFRLQAEARTVELRTLLDTRGIRVLADVGLIERVMGNLIENALRHTSSGGQVRTEMSVEEAVVRVRVVDTGEGIQADHLPRILDRFFSLRDPKDRSRAGLGLSIVQRIMKLHDQTVTVLSQRGVGTTVEISLARAPSPSMTSFAKSA
jgi:two-component system, OmpR family, sensor kinase